jgi:tripartite-type tricarboxylate transporter receptor subunit TctC
VTTFVAIGFVLIVNPQLPVKSVADLTAYMKARPGKASYASGNQFGRVVAEWYRQIHGLEAVHVPYKGVPQAAADLMAGRIEFMFADASFGIQAARSGKARALAMTTPKRISSAPDLPTMMEAGVAGYVADGWLAFFYPARTPMDIARRFADATNAVIRTDQAREFLARQYAEPMPGSPEALAKSVIDENAKWGAIVKKAGIEPE